MSVFVIHLAELTHIRWKAFCRERGKKMIDYTTAVLEAEMQRFPVVVERLGVEPSPVRLVEPLRPAANISKPAVHYREPEALRPADDPWARPPFWAGRPK